MDGALVLASRDIQYNTFKTVKPLLEVCGQKKSIFITPVSRYFAGKCCLDPDHIPNFVEDEYRRTLEEGLFKSRKFNKDFAFCLQMR